MNNAGGSAAGALGGTTHFQHNSRAGAATIVNAAGEIAGAMGGITKFAGNAGAGSAYISNRTSLSVSGGGRGTAFFKDSSSAQNATIDNQGGTQSINAFTGFSQSATAGNARITNFGGRAAGAGGDLTQFVDGATAGAASLVMVGGGVSGALGGATVFFAESTAGNATLDVRGATVAGAAGGSVRFTNQSNAGQSTVTVQGAQAHAIGGPEGGVVSFTFDASAAQAHFTIGGNLHAFGSPGRVQFDDASTAADASFVTLAGINNGGRLTFAGTAVRTASAGHASISNGSRLPGAVSTGNDFGGAALFLAHSSADRAAITNAAGATAFGAQTVFRADSTAASAVIFNAGGLAGDRGGITFFHDTSNAGRANITSQAGALNATGINVFDGTASAALSTLNAGGASTSGDLGGRVLFTAQSTAAKSLIVVGNDGRATTFSGVIGGSAPAVPPSLAVLGGTLTLTGANNYAGRTQVGDGVNADSGKLVAANTSGSATGSGEVRIERGGTLGGSGFIAGPVTLRDGGILATGDPVTLALQSSLTWDGGGLIRRVLGADDAGSDHIIVQNLVRGASGPFDFELIDTGIVGGASYTLLQFNSLVGFVASDFTFSGAGAAGNFSMVDGAIGFTAAVPEPSSAALLVIGLLSIAWGVKHIPRTTRA